MTASLPHDWFEFDVVNREFCLVTRRFVGTKKPERIKLVLLDGSADPNLSSNLLAGYKKALERDCLDAEGTGL